jgi:outer membrane receptor protein involved in Fe transport
VPPDSLRFDTSSTETSTGTLKDSLIPELQKVVVTSGRRERLLESNRSVLMITPEEWQGTNKSVADVIAEHTGIQTRKYGGMGSFQTVSIRGIKGSEVLVLLDGVPLNSAMGGAVDLGTINPMHLQEIEVYKGISSMMFGGNSLGGVINLKTKSDTKGSLCDLQTEIGSFGKQRVSAGFDYGFTPQISLYGAASFNNCENNIPYLDRNNTYYGPSDGGPNDPRNDDTIRTLKNHQYRSFDVMLHPVMIVPQHNKRVVGNIYYSDIDRHIPAEESKENETARYLEKNVVAKVSLQHDDSTRFQIVPSLGYLFTDGVTRWSERDQGFGSSHGGRINGEASSGMAEHSLDGELEMKYYPFENVKLNGLLFCQAGDANPLYDRGSGNHGDWHSRRAVGGVATEITTTFDHLTINAGGTVSGIYDKTEGGLDGVSSHVIVFLDTITVLWNGEVGASYLLFDKTKLYINAGHYSNQPSLRERFGAKGAVMANPELKAEEVQAAEAGLKCNLRKVYLECTAFYTRAYNTIEFKSDGYLVRPVNNSGSRNNGLEFSSIIEMPKYVSLDVSATWQKTKNLDIQYRGRKNKMMPDEPEISVASGVNIKPTTGLTLSYKFQFKSVYYHDLANDSLQYRVPSKFNNSGYTNGSFNHDVLLSWKVTRNLDVRFSVTNMKLGKMQSLENSIEMGIGTIITPANEWNFCVGYSF